MDKITFKHDVTLYDQFSTQVIDSPSAGMVVGTNEDFTIIPKFVPKGESKVAVVRQTPGIIAFDAGIEVGYVAIAEPVVEAEGGEK